MIFWNCYSFIHVWNFEFSVLAWGNDGFFPLMDVDWSKVAFTAQPDRDDPHLVIILLLRHPNQSSDHLCWGNFPDPTNKTIEENPSSWNRSTVQAAAPLRVYGDTEILGACPGVMAGGLLLIRTMKMTSWALCDSMTKELSERSWWKFGVFFVIMMGNCCYFEAITDEKRMTM